MFYLLPPFVQQACSSSPASLIYPLVQPESLILALAFE